MSRNAIRFFMSKSTIHSTDSFNKTDSFRAVFTSDTVKRSFNWFIQTRQFPQEWNTAVFA